MSESWSEFPQLEMRRARQIDNGAVVCRYMADEVNLGGAMYISSRRAAEITGYKQDYVGQLARSGRVAAKRIGGLWYVHEESLLGHKKSADSYVPIPPQLVAVKELAPEQPNSLISFDGKRYVSAPEASRMTSYHPDYIGHLARSGKILSKQVGNRWFIEVEGLVSHKDEKDRMLQSVQVRSVGLTNLISRNRGRDDFVPFYSYRKDSRDLLPSCGYGEVGYRDTAEEVQYIPIRVVQKPRTTGNLSKVMGRPASRKPDLSILYGSFTAAVMTVVIIIAFNINLISARPILTNLHPDSNILNSALAGIVSDTGASAIDAFIEFFSKHVEYKRLE